MEITLDFFLFGRSSHTFVKKVFLIALRVGRTSFSSCPQNSGVCLSAGGG